MQTSIFDKDNRIEKLDKLGDVFKQFNDMVDWNDFRPILDNAMPRNIPRNVSRGTLMPHGQRRVGTKILSKWR